MDTHLEAKCSDNRAREIKSIDCSGYQLYSNEAKPITWSNHYKLHFIDAYSSSTATRFDKWYISFLTKRVIAFQAVKLQDDPTSVYCHHLPLRTGGPGHKVSVITRT